MKYPAFLFDLNGTMVNDMDYHINAWHTLLNKLGADLSYEETKAQCYGKNSELIERVFPNRFNDQEKFSMGFEKEKVYQQAFRSKLALLPGLRSFIEYYHEQGVRMAIGSAAIPYNIDFVLDGLNLRSYFDVIVSADDVQSSKPDPETYIKCADLLNILPEKCLVFEDAPKGIESALNAKMKCIAITSMHTATELNVYPNVIAATLDYSTLSRSLFH